MVDLAGFERRELPGDNSMTGATVTVEPIVDSSRFGELWEAFSDDPDDQVFTYLGYGPFQTRDAFEAFAGRTYLAKDILFHAIVPTAGPFWPDTQNAGKAAGVMALMRIDTANGVAEIGHICLAPRLQRTVAVTEAVFLLINRIFADLGYRRFEWKCDDANARSKRAAERYGFGYEGLFRQHMIVKGRNRDTAWFSMIDEEWPNIRNGFEAWLDARNFDADGGQRRALKDIRDATASGSGGRASGGVRRRSVLPPG